MEAATTTTPNQQARDHTLVHFEIPSDNPEKARKFYEQMFGWKFSKMPGSGDAQMGEYWLVSHKDAGPNETMGGLYKKTMGETGFTNYFAVANIDQALAKAKTLGANIVKGKEEIPTIGWFAIVQDPDKNTFAFFQSARRM